MTDILLALKDPRQCPLFLLVNVMYSSESIEKCAVL
jgi:hypothetical protein